MPETTLLVLVDAAISEGNALLRTLRPVAQVQRITAPKDEPGVAPTRARSETSSKLPSPRLWNSRLSDGS